MVIPDRASTLPMTPTRANIFFRPPGQDISIRPKNAANFGQHRKMGCGESENRVENEMLTNSISAAEKCRKIY